MASLPARILSPEEQELARKQALLASLESELLDRELALATLKLELDAFERRYLSMVGRRYADLDELEALIAEALFRKQPGDQTVRKRAEKARGQATASAQSVGRITAQSLDKTVRQSDSLRDLYYHAAKLLHPDLSLDPAQKDIRKRRMAEVNEAYAAGDEERIRQILRNWHASPETVEGTGTATELVRVIRKIAQLESRLQAIATEMAQLQASELFDLRRRVLEAAENGRDLLDEMATRIDQQIANAKSRLQSVR